ncbi:alkaline phosphatase D family protein [Actinocorallia sp. A-T 12471]|uniref:alkaline phosphatase D family protein n=1 Tax=Actinocorallia sp. A-T 12471 TaxID=3089813 RepID=UPI0029D32401|nr:alkaline phosphatase D family protein [Actinocorallia sp. A-T 12471]MDX6740751.1 alkaline phosphatase D family protein [Actinocorallia sp. A-T 12471]
MSFTRRDLLRSGLAAGGALAVPGAFAAPALARVRPSITHGVQSGDVTDGRALVWTRADRPSRVYVEYATRPDFRGSRTVRGPWLTPGSDLTGQVRLSGLPSGADVHYRVTLDDGRAKSAPELGSFRTPPRRHEAVSFVWGGDLAGQGWGINEEFGGYRIFAAMAATKPDFFLCSGDWVYSDGPLTATVALPDGTTWKNLMTDEKAKVAETLAEYRGQFRYNLLDAHLRAFNAKVPIVYQWDDHEVRNNWYPGQILDDDRYTEKRVDVLAARASRAAHEYLPITPGRTLYRKLSYGPDLDVFVLDMRSYKNPNTPNLETSGPGLLGPAQTAWLKRELTASRATWKVIANDLPLGLIVPDGSVDQEGVGNVDSGLPKGREREIADVLRHAHRHRVKGLVFLTADVHYAAAHHYSPNRASFKDFAPFWEFVAGPLNAGTFGPNTLDGTFGPRQEFVKVGPRANASPAEGAQFFGHAHLDPRTKTLTVKLVDLTGKTLYTKSLTPA